MKRMAQLMVVLVALTFIASSAAAVTLWDQSDYDLASPGYFNSEGGGPPFGLTWYTVGDVVVDTEWMITEITQYYGAVDPNWGLGIFQGAVNIFPKTGSMPGAGDDPTIGMIVPMTGTVNGEVTVVTASGLSILLTPGEYWIGITPSAAAGPFGPEPQLPSLTHIGDDSASYDAFGFPMPMWFDFNPGFDGSLVISGDAVVPTDSVSWGKVKALYGE